MRNGFLFPISKASQFVKPTSRRLSPITGDAVRTLLGKRPLHGSKATMDMPHVAIQEQIEAIQPTEWKRLDIYIGN